MTVNTAQARMQITRTASTPPLPVENSPANPGVSPLAFWLMLEMTLSELLTMLAPSKLAISPARTAVFHLPRRASSARAR